MNWEKAVTRVSIVAALVLLLFPAVVRADTINFTDSTGIPGVTYTLTGNFTACAGTTNVCVGNLHIDTSGATTPSGTWYIGWTSIKLDGGTVTILSTSQAGWAAANGSASKVSLWWTGKSNSISEPTDAFSTMYATSFLKDSALTTGDLGSGFLVNGSNTYDIAFTFNFNGGTLNSMPSLKVGYYSIDDGGNASSTDPAIRQMSQQSTVTVVPEPGSMALFGTGLAGVAAFVRRRSRMAT